MMLTCAICGRQFLSITNSHLLRAHGISTHEYIAKFGGPLVSEETRERRRRDGGVDWDDVGLGSVPDSSIALDTGIERRRVAYERQRRGIPAFQGLILTQEGNPCRSQYEAMYDAYLHWKDVEHRHEVRVGGLPYIADFLVQGTYVEIVGMLRFGKYAQKLAKKRAAYERAGVSILWLSSEEVTKCYEGSLVRVQYRIERSCERCGKRTHDLVRGVCRTCYMYVWRSEGQEAQCAECGKTFIRAGSSVQKYCSRGCYAKSLRQIQWPALEWIEEESQRKSLKQIARCLGVNPGALYQHVHRERQRTATPQIISDFIRE